MHALESAFWSRLKANRLAYSVTIAATLAVGILIGTVVSASVKGKENAKSGDATPLSIPAPQQLSNAFSQISKQLEPTVVNINTESTVKNPHRNLRRAPGNNDDNANPDGSPLTISSTASSVARAAKAVRVAPIPDLSGSVHWAPASLSTPRATSSQPPRGRKS